MLSGELKIYHLSTVSKFFNFQIIYNLLNLKVNSSMKMVVDNA